MRDCLFKPGKRPRARAKKTDNEKSCPPASDNGLGRHHDGYYVAHLPQELPPLVLSVGPPGIHDDLGDLLGRRRRGGPGGGVARAGGHGGGGGEVGGEALDDVGVVDLDRVGAVVPPAALALSKFVFLF